MLSSARINRHVLSSSNAARRSPSNAAYFSALAVPMIERHADPSQSPRRPPRRPPRDPHAGGGADPGADPSADDGRARRRVPSISHTTPRPDIYRLEMSDSGGGGWQGAEWCVLDTDDFTHDCADMDFDATDAWTDNGRASWYDSYPSTCGYYDDSDFDSGRHVLRMRRRHGVRHLCRRCLRSDFGCHRWVRQMLRSGSRGLVAGGRHARGRLLRRRMDVPRERLLRVDRRRRRLRLGDRLRVHRRGGRPLHRRHGTVRRPLLRPRRPGLRPPDRVAVGQPGAVQRADAQAHDTLRRRHGRRRARWTASSAAPTPMEHRTAPVASTVPQAPTAATTTTTTSPRTTCAAIAAAETATTLCRRRDQRRQRSPDDFDRADEGRILDVRDDRRLHREWAVHLVAQLSVRLQQLRFLRHHADGRGPLSVVAFDVEYNYLFLGLLDRRRR